MHKLRKREPLGKRHAIRKLLPLAGLVSVLAFGGCKAKEKAPEKPAPQKVECVDSKDGKRILVDRDCKPILDKHGYVVLASKLYTNECKPDRTGQFCLPDGKDKLNKAHRDWAPPRY